MGVVGNNPDERGCNGGPGTGFEGVYIGIGFVFVDKQ